MFEYIPIGVRNIFFFNLALRDRWVAEQAAQIRAGAKVLDVGAGSCPYRPLFAHCDYRSQDFTGLQGSQVRHGAYGNIDYVCDATQIPVPDGSFDVVLCTEMLEHVPDPLAVVREIGRVLKPGGVALLTAPLGSGLHQEPYHFFGGFTPYWYRTMLRSVGFGEVLVESNGGFFRNYGQESLRFLQMTRPLGGVLPRWLSLLFLPIWLCFFLPCCLIPILAVWLDRFDRERRFTVGYHVKAIRGHTAADDRG